MGDRLKECITDEDLMLLDRYRRDFRPAYDQVVTAVQNALKVEVSGRPAKSTTAIIDKLERTSMRLSQMQDIAGCRIVVEDTIVQDKLLKQMSELFNSKIIDRRTNPSHGYRAVHVIAYADRKPIEIQIRSKSQHLWAELSEKLSDRLGVELKYGSGNRETLRFLQGISKSIADGEKQEREIYALSTDVGSFTSTEEVTPQELKYIRQEVEALQKSVKVTQARERKLIAQFINRLD